MEDTRNDAAHAERLRAERAILLSRVEDLKAMLQALHEAATRAKRCQPALGIHLKTVRYFDRVIERFAERRPGFASALALNVWSALSARWPQGFELDAYLALCAIMVDAKKAIAIAIADTKAIEKKLWGLGMPVETAIG